MRYKSKPIFISDMGTVPSFIVEDKPNETKEQEWLWHVNSMRDHDGLKPLRYVPDYVVFKPLPK